jgi:hypothetical protein
MTKINHTQFQRLVQANDLGVRLEIIGGLPLWEAHPVLKHQRAIDRIRDSIAPPPADSDPSNGCGCIHYADVYIRFGDGSLTRPDIAIFCREPDEQDEAIVLLPEAVIEVVSRGYEAKDLEIGPRFYLSQGIKDIVVFDPDTLLVLHIRREGATRTISPVPLTLTCGCTCVV